MKEITILGSGMAGLGAAYKANQENVSAVIYDKNDHPGGHTASLTTPEGFVFDEGPHISFTKDERIQDLFAANVDDAYESFPAHVNNYWQGQWIKHPAQCNLYGLPTDMVVNVLRDFIQAQNSEPGKINNYADWLLASYGQTFAENFPMEYGLRYHTTTADNMTIDWLGPRLYRPNIEEILRGALSPETEDVHYVTGFRYPSQGGFMSYLNKFFENSDIQLNHKVVSIDPDSKELVFENGKKESYKDLVSSIPLPDLIPLINSVPEEVQTAVGKLACTSCLAINIGLDREDISEAHWTYFYDREFTFTRISFPHMFAPGNVPAGTGSIQAEIYFSKKYKPLEHTPQECIDLTIQDLKRCGLIRDDDKILYKGARQIDYANIIFDLDREDALKIVHQYLKDINIQVAGRYGLWGYQWTDESFKSGEQAVANILG